MPESTWSGKHRNIFFNILEWILCIIFILYDFTQPQSWTLYVHFQLPLNIRTKSKKKKKHSFCIENIHNITIYTTMTNIVHWVTGDNFLSGPSSYLPESDACNCMKCHARDISSYQNGWCDATLKTSPRKVPLQQ